MTNQIGSDDSGLPNPGCHGRQIPARALTHSWPFRFFLNPDASKVPMYPPPATQPRSPSHLSHRRATAGERFVPAAESCMYTLPYQQGKLDLGKRVPTLSCDGTLNSTTFPHSAYYSSSTPYHLVSVGRLLRWGLASKQPECLSGVDLAGQKSVTTAQRRKIVIGGVGNFLKARHIIS